MRTVANIKAARSAMRDRTRAEKHAERDKIYARVMSVGRIRPRVAAFSEQNRHTIANGDHQTPTLGGRGMPRIQVISPDIVNRQIETHEKIDEIHQKIHLMVAVIEFSRQHGRDCPEAVAAGVAGPHSLDIRMTEDRLQEVAPLLIPPIPSLNNQWWVEVMEGSMKSCPLGSGENPEDNLPDIGSLLDSVHAFTAKLERLAEKQ